MRRKRRRERERKKNCKLKWHLCYSPVGVFREVYLVLFARQNHDRIINPIYYCSGKESAMKKTGFPHRKWYYSNTTKKIYEKP